MQIHAIQTRQTIYSISQAFSVPAEEIISANQISDPSRLVVGQTIVIPITGSYYWVREGDSLTSIAAKFGISAQQLAQINRLNESQPLRIGLRLYIPPRPKKSAEINAYIEPRGTSLAQELRTS
jgi:spore germination protein